VSGSYQPPTTVVASEHAPPTLGALLCSLEVSADQAAGMAELADRVYGHMLRVIDLDRLFAIEQCVWSELSRLGIHDEDGGVATTLLAEALHRVGHTPDRYVNMIPDGITPDEVMAAEYDDDCVMCLDEAADFEYRRSGRKCQDLHRDAEDKDFRRLMERAASSWRQQHAEALRRFGLY
jgi:hypothetical protein